MMKTSLYFLVAALVANVYFSLAADTGLQALVDEMFRERLADCDFDKNFCKWSNDKDDSFDWKRRKAKTLNKHTGTKGDITDLGSYAYIDSSFPRKTDDVAKLSSITLGGTKCMYFYYSMHGSTVGSLTVVDSPGKILWSKHGQQGSGWHIGSVPVSGNKYKVTFVASVGSRGGSEIALDDVFFLPRSCVGGAPVPSPSPTDTGSCSFDFGPCGWTNEGGANELNWLTGSQHSRNTPKLDHGRNPGGKYFYFHGSRKGGKAVMTSEVMCGPQCLQFFYHMKGFNLGILNVYQRFKTNQRDRVWTAQKDHGDNWNEALVNLGKGATNCYQLVVEGVSSDHVMQGRIAVDDFHVTPGTCCMRANKMRTTPEKGRCNFDNGFCSWKQSNESDCDWEIGSKRASSQDTGPDLDASGNGSFAFIESSEPRVSGDKARLVSSPLEGSWCMRFKYHMFGADVGSLAVYKSGILVWRRKGNHGNQWFDALVSTGCSDPVFTMEIEATVGGWRGDIAIDEIEFTSGRCPPKVDSNKKADVARKADSQLPVIAPQAVQIPQEICGFEDGFCNWNNVADDDFDWTRHSGKSPSSGTGPSHDSTGFGTYVYIEASERNPNETARLESKELQGNTCLIFHYHMYGADVAELRVETRDLDTNSKEVTWSQEGNQGDGWKAVRLMLIGQNYKVSFVGVRGKSFRGDIALDDVSIHPGDCSLEKNYVRWKLEQGNCTFNDDVFCLWTNTNGDDFDWLLGNGETASHETGPNDDHSGGGTYAFIETSVPRKKGDKARLVFLSYPVEQCMEFFYSMNGRDVGALRLYQISQTVEIKLWEKKEHQSKQWEKARVTIPKNSNTPWIVIEGEVGNSYRGDIAVDNISFTRGACATSTEHR